jgi:hypothetical protein
MLDKVTQRLQGLLGTGKDAVKGKSGDDKSEHVKAAVKGAGEQVKDAALRIKDALKGD